MKLFKNYRVIKFQGKFIAQTRKCFLFHWQGIGQYNLSLWDTFEYQITRCSFDTLEEANEHVKKYKDFTKKNKTKYHYE
jgi:hypothetical protein